jgi:hypothetical protein
MPAPSPVADKGSHSANLFARAATRVVPAVTAEIPYFWVLGAGFLWLRVNSTVVDSLIQAPYKRHQQLDTIL